MYVMLSLKQREGGLHLLQLCLSVVFDWSHSPNTALRHFSTSLSKPFMPIFLTMTARKTSSFISWRIFTTEVPWFDHPLIFKIQAPVFLLGRGGVEGDICLTVVFRLSSSIIVIFELVLLRGGTTGSCPGTI